MSADTYHRAVELLLAEVAGETIAMNAGTGETFRFSEVAVFVWTSLGRPRRFEELQDELLEHYDVEPEQCALDLRELLSALLNQGIIRVHLA